MSLFDSLAVIILSLSLIYSIFRGMVREIFSLLAYFGGYLVAIKFQDTFAKSLSTYISNDTACGIISFLLIFLATVVGISLLGKGFQKLVHSTAGLSGIDRLLGGIIGIAKAVIILIILMFPLKFFPELYGKVTRDSILAPHLNGISKTLVRGVKSNGLMDELPDINLSGVKEKFKNLKDIDKLAQDLTPKGWSPKDGNEEDEEMIGNPQENYTREDETKLKDLLLTLDKDKS